MGYSTGIKWYFKLVKEYVENIGYILISDEYINSNTKLILKDKEGYYYVISLSKLRNNRKPQAFDVHNPYTIQNIKLWCKLNNKPFELLSNIYESATKKLQWKCLKENCKESFKASWANIFSHHGCGVCHGKQVGISNCLETKNPELAKEWHPTKNGDLTPFDVTISSGIEPWWQCKDNPKHVWQASIANRNKENGCPYCSHRLPSDEYNLLFYNPELCKEWNYNKNMKSPKEYCPSGSQKVWWLCKECSHEWYVSINSRVSNNTGCPECNKPKGEKRCKEVFINKGLIEILQEEFDNLSNKYNNKYFIPQKTFEDLVGLGGGLLSYDFYIPQYNLLIEYQGEYHDQIILKYKDEPIKLAEDRLEKQKEHDRRKKKYAENHKIKLLEVWYWDFENIEEILNKTILK